MSKKVLFVDDNQLTLKWASDNATQLGFEVVTYQYSFGIHAFVKRHRPDAVFLDVRMPAVNGSVVCRKMRDDRSLSGTRVYLCSALDENSLRTLAIESGAHGYIVKDDNAEEMLRRVKAALSGP